MEYTLRDYFAGQALAGILAGEEGCGFPALNAARAYEHADAMLAAREPGGIELLKRSVQRNHKSAPV